jgi:uncharacterized membrane protein
LAARKTAKEISMKRLNGKFITGISAMLMALAFAMIGCDQGGGEENEQAPQSGLTLKGTEAGAAYAVRVYPNPEEEAVGSDTWSEATADEKLAANGEATAEGAEVFVSLSAPDESRFAGTGSFLVVVTADGTARYAIAAFIDGSAALDLANDMKEPPETPVYGISLSETGTLEFPSANAGYAAQKTTTITITNTGKDATGKLTLAVAGANADSFTLGKKTITNIAVGGKATFTVRPNTGLKAGVYTATVSVTGETIAAKGFGVSFTVNNKDGSPPENPDAPKPDPVYSIELSRTGTLTFPPANAGYGPPATRAVTVRNTGNQPTGSLTLALSGNNSGSFGLSKSTITGIAVNGSDSFTAVPNTGLAAGTYTATVTVSGSNGISAGFDVSFEVKPAGTPIYAIELSQTGPLVFPDAIFDYAARTPQQITIYNRGNQPTGNLTVALTGAAPSAFTLNKPAMGSIAVNGSDSFTAVPNTGLAAGTYTATVTVSGGNNISAKFDVSFKVKAVSGYGIELSPTGPLTFEDAVEDGPVPGAQTITVSNRGSQPTGGLSLTMTGDSAFTLNKTTMGSIAVNGSDTFTIAPNSGLGEGEYTATVSVTGGNGISAGFVVSFTVKPAGTRIYSISLSETGTYPFPPAVFGYGEQAVKSVTIHNTGNQPTGALTAAVGAGFEITAPANGAVTSIQSGGTTAFSVRPKTGLGIGPHTATVSVTGGNGITANFAVSFEVEEAFYEIALSGNGTPFGADYTHQFGTVTLPDYTEPAALTVTITNTGNQPTGALSVALTGTDSGSFILNDSAAGSSAAINSIAATGGTATFNVAPSASIDTAKTYRSSVIVTMANGGTDALLGAVFDVSFEVKPAPAYAIALSRNGDPIDTDYIHQFGKVIPPDYTPPDALSVTVTNTGNQPTGALTVALSGTGSGSFILNDSAAGSSAAINSIAAGGNSVSFTVTPRTGLAAGDYTATVTVSNGLGGNQSITANFAVSFDVEEAAYAIALSRNGTPIGADYTHQFGEAATLPPYTQPDALSVTVTNSGNQPTGGLSVALTGDNPSAFTRSPATITGIAVNSADSFTIAPNSGLGAGTYTATVTVSGGTNIEPRSFNISFEVYAPLVTGFRSLAAALVYLDAHSGDGTVDAPVTLKLDFDDLSSTADRWTAIASALSARTKYVALDLLSCRTSSTYDLTNFNILAGSPRIVSIVLPGFVTKFTGGDGTAYPNLKAISGENVTRLTALTFQLCTALTTVSFPKVTTVTEKVFLGCTSLSTADFPAVTTIEADAFGDCTSLTAAPYPLVTEIGESAFSGCTSLAAADFPLVTDLGAYAFFGCTSLTAASFPEAASIREYAFYKNSSLTAPFFPKATVIERRAFGGCTSLAAADFPLVTRIEGNKSLTTGAFSGCTSLSTANFPNVTHIGYRIFNGTGTTPLTVTMGADAPYVEGSTFVNSEGTADTNGKTVIVRVPSASVSLYNDAWQTAFKGAGTDGLGTANNSINLTIQTY